MLLFTKVSENITSHFTNVPIFPVLFRIDHDKDITLHL